MEDQEIIKEFLIESSEGMTRLEQEIVELEKRPKDPELLGSIFRTIHSIKGTCGFLGFSSLEGVTHIAESLLSQLRNGERQLSSELTSLVLETMDAIKVELASIEATLKESGDTYEDLRRRLSLACSEVVLSTSAPSTDAAAHLPVATSAVAASGSAENAIEAKTGLETAAVSILEGDIASPAEAEIVCVNESPASGQCETPQKQATPKGSSIADSTIRVDVGQLDKVMNLVGELVLARNQILQFTSRQEDVSLNATAQRLNLITTQLQEGVMKTRMQPIGVLWNKLPRVVRDLAAACGKQIDLEMDGTETELDKSIIESIKDPLTHIVRNSCDHGFESPAERIKHGKSAHGRLSLRAYHEGGQVNIEIGDDGRGIDTAKVKRKAVEKGLLRQDQAERLSDREAANLVFLPGFSTAEQVTNVSGRGVGMDVVRTNIEKIGGIVDLVSHTGQGTVVKIRIPLTLAIIPGLVVRSGGERFVIPQVSLLELLRLEGDAVQKQIERVHGAPVYRRRGSLLPIAYLNEVLGLAPASLATEVLNIVVLEAEGRQFGLVVDAINDTQEIVVKPLGKQLKCLPCFAGATIMGDGGVALILDVLGIGHISGVVSEAHDEKRVDTAANESNLQDLQTFLLFRAGRFDRLAVPLSMVARLEEFPHQRIEQGSGRLVVQYRDQILPLIPLSSILEGQQVALSSFPDPAQVIVFTEDDHMVGLIVHQILDIQNDHIQIVNRGNNTHPGLSGSAVIGGRVTDFIDLPEVLREADAAWSKDKAQTRSSILLADNRSFSRGLVRNYLELAGHSVLEVADADDALNKLEGTSVGAAVIASSLPSGGMRRLIDRMRDQPKLSTIPVVVLDENGPESALQAEDPLAVYVDRFDRCGLIASLESLNVGHKNGARESAGNCVGGRQ